MNHFEYYTQKEALGVLGISQRTLYKIIKEEEISVLKMGSSQSSGVRYLKKEIDNFDYAVYKQRKKKKRKSSKQSD